MYHAFLITAQFVLSATLVLSAAWSPFPVLGFLFASPGIGLAVWAWLTMGLRRLRIHPSTTEQTQLITRGPYAFVRHPMYTGLLWFTVALLPAPFAWWRIVMWFVLLSVLIAKTHEEERAMCGRFPEYTSYRQQVGGLFPKLDRHGESRK